MRIRDYLDPGGTLLTRRLDQLCTTLETLSARLRATMASVLGETLGGMVRDLALRVLGEVTDHLAAPAPAPPRFYRPDDEVMPDERNYWDDDEMGRGQPQEENFSPAATPERLPTALATGLTTAAWWLRRWAGQGCLWTTLAVGLAATGAAYLGGPLVAAALQLAGTATQFSTPIQASGRYDSIFDRYDRS